MLIRKRGSLLGANEILMMTQNKHLDKLIAFKHSIAEIELPKQFTFPFYYDPHPLAILACNELQEYIQQHDFKHNFGLDSNINGIVIGKMFGVLVVQTPSSELGYLAAFSGKLADSNDHTHFVPPIFDMLSQGGFYRKGEKRLYKLSEKIQQMLDSTTLNNLTKTVAQIQESSVISQVFLKNRIKKAKEERAKIRMALHDLPEHEQATENKQLNRKSVLEQLELKALKKQNRLEIEKAEQALYAFYEQIEQLKKERKKLSNSIQNQLFSQYHFLNAKHQSKSVLELFQHIENGKPPSGAGECCAPKLLNFAYQHDLKPICMAEFWWGASPASEIRKHKMFYPACKGKCEPILNHMLVGLKVEANPMDQNPGEGKSLEILYEDEDIMAINKPAEMLSVPGKKIKDSVLERLKKMLPNASGPLLVHRLDMSTSGILLVAKNKAAHDHLQKQFIKRSIKKRYVALLDGQLTEQTGQINLPLRVDLDDRPRQLVCYEHGKSAITTWELIEVQNRRSKVYFYPLTGRTHQLRVHAAHQFGLNTPIVGDDLYGTKAERLYLHAEQITFIHPKTKVSVCINCPATF